MVRAPCSEKMGVKKGAWTPEEDQILAAYIQRHGPGNWRALPRQAGLLRCGKSCRLRWMNYLRPDIKRGNFTREEEETIIRLHETFGNRWSAIAAKLPGRTDNEIKNVWHAHLKKLVSPNMSSTESKKKMKGGCRTKEVSEPMTMQLDSDSENARYVDSARFISVSPEQSHSDFSSSANDSSTVSGEIRNGVGAKEGSFSSEEFPEIDESFWLDALSMYDSAASMDFTGLEIPSPPPITEHFNPFSSSDSHDMDFWLKVFMGTVNLQEIFV